MEIRSTRGNGKQKIYVILANGKFYQVRANNAEHALAKVARQVVARQVVA